METPDTKIVSLNVQPRATKYRWFVAVLFFFIYAVAAADRANLGVVLPFISKDFKMTNAEAGALASLFLLAYAFAQLPSAWFLQKFGVRKVFSVSMILTSLMTGLTGLAGSLATLKLCRLGLGVAEGPLPVSVTTSINNWFPSKEKGTASGIFLSSVKFGPVFTPIIGAAIIASFGWQDVFLFFALPGLVLAAIWFMMVPDRPADSRFVNRAELETIAETSGAGESPKGPPVTSKPIPGLDRVIRVREEKVLDSPGAIFSSWNLWGCALGYCCQLGISSVLLAWIPTYLLTVKKFSIMGMGFAAAAPWVGAVFGNILGGLLSDRVLGKRRKPGMMVSALSTAGMMFALIHSPADPTTYAALIFLTGMLLSFGYSAYMAYPMSLVAKARFPLSSAMVNMGGQLGGAATPWLTGILLDTYGWDSVFVFMASISILTFLILLTISEPLKIERT